jgi:hypothetical protein
MTIKDKEIVDKMQKAPVVEPVSETEDTNSHYDTLEQEQTELVKKIDETIVSEAIVEESIPNGMPGIEIDSYFTIQFNNLRVPKLLSCVKMFGKPKPMRETAPPFSLLDKIDNIYVPSFRFSEGGAGSVKKNSKKSSSVKKQINLLFRDMFGFHPMLPLFLMTGSLYDQMKNSNVLASWDRNLFVQFYFFLEFLFVTLRDSFLDKEKQKDAISIGYALRELLFTSNQYEERIDLCKKILGLDDQMTQMFLSITGIISNDICGMIQQSSEDIRQGTLLMRKPVFMDFIKNIPVRDIFSQNIPEKTNETILFDKIKELYMQLGDRISKDKETPFLIKRKSSRSKTKALSFPKNSNTISRLFKGRLMSGDRQRVVPVKTGGRKQSKTEKKRSSSVKKNKTKKQLYSNF